MNGSLSLGPVGKTSLISLYIDPAATFNPEHEPTVEGWWRWPLATSLRHADEYTATKQIGDTEVLVTILDTSGMRPGGCGTGLTDPCRERGVR
jgi:hypothetical protein